MIQWIDSIQAYFDYRQHTSRNIHEDNKFADCKKNSTYQSLIGLLNVELDGFVSEILQ